MHSGKTVGAVIAAAGHGTRFGGDLPKQFLTMRDRDGNVSTVLGCTLKAFSDNREIDAITVAVSPEFEEKAAEIIASSVRSDIEVHVTCGGNERQDTVANAIKSLNTDLILVHDAARPFVTDELIERVINDADVYGAAVPCVSARDTVRIKDECAGDGAETSTVDRNRVYLVQTPQGFRSGILKDAYEKAFREGFYGTDDAVLAERAGYGVRITEGDYGNIKITTKDDMPVAPKETRTGMGYDVHRLVSGRRLWLCGVEIPYEKGLLGHSDADVALHALMDAMLGAAALGDIGKLFPDNDPEYEGISSMTLAERTNKAVQAAGFRVVNCDITVVCERPKISPYTNEMRMNISGILGIGTDCVSVKGTTTEGLGFTGSGEGIAAFAVCTLKAI